MKKILFISMIGCLWVSAAIAMGERQPDPECFASNTLRVQIDDRVFAFPKESISVLKPTVPLDGDSYIPEKATEICQKKDESPLTLDSLRITPNIVPIVCNDKCQKSKGHNRLSGTVYVAKNTAKTKEEIRQEAIIQCKEEPYFNTCKHGVVYKNIGFYFQYYLAAYPLEQIEQTEQLALEYLKQHDVTPTTSSSATAGE